MLAVARAVRAPRYGSVAELAAYASLSPKTIRRLVGSGKVRSFRVGRRMLIPYADLDRHILGEAVGSPLVQEPPNMATATTVAGGVDPETGRLRPLTEEQRRERSEALNRALDEMEAITDETDTDEAWRDVFRGVDEARPHRPLFEGQH